MNKVFNKWFRRIHRWIALPTALLIPITAVIRLAGTPLMVEFLAKWEKLPSILMLVMAITGAYLYLLPYIVKNQRKQRMMAQ